MITDENIIELFFARSEQGIRELDIKYGKDFHNLSYHIVFNLLWCDTNAPEVIQPA